MRTCSTVAPRIAMALVVSAVAAASAVAEPQRRSQHERWEVYTLAEDGDLICYASAPPDDKAPASTEHGNVAFMVATWRSGAAREQPMLAVGYPLRSGAPSSARVGSDRFRMFTDGSEAFLESDQEETRLVRAMERGYTMRVETVSQDGTQTTYEFSLRGVTAALRAVRQACG